MCSMDEMPGGSSCSGLTWLEDVGFGEVIEVGGVVNALDFNGDGCRPLPVRAGQRVS